MDRELSHRGGDSGPRFGFPYGELARTPPRPLLLASPLVTAMVTTRDQIRRGGPPLAGRPLHH